LQIPEGINQLPLKASIKAKEMEDLFSRLIKRIVEKEVGISARKKKNQ
jgi:hypothetical protein